MNFSNYIFISQYYVLSIFHEFPPQRKATILLIEHITNTKVEQRAGVHTILSFDTFLKTIGAEMNAPERSKR